MREGVVSIKHLDVLHQNFVCRNVWYMDSRQDMMASQALHFGWLISMINMLDVGFLVYIFYRFEAFGLSSMSNIS